MPLFVRVQDEEEDGQKPVVIGVPTPDFIKENFKVKIVGFHAMQILFEELSVVIFCSAKTWKARTFLPVSKGCVH